MQQTGTDLPQDVQHERQRNNQRRTALVATLKSSAQKACKTITLVGAAGATVALEKAACIAARLTNRCDGFNERIVNWVKQQHP